MSAVQAKEYGLIDEVLPPRKKGETEPTTKDKK
jgi:ATP-dependent protease ClpP protease subunit